MENLRMLSQAQLAQIAALPKEVQETVRTMLLESEVARQEALKNNTGIKYRTEPHSYVAQIVEKSPGLTSTLELIALAVDYMLPGCLTTAKEKHSVVFDEYSGVQFMQVIAATEVVKWKSVRDINGKMAARLLTLDPNYIPEKEQILVEGVEAEIENDQAVLTNLPIVQINDSTEEEETTNNVEETEVEEVEKEKPIKSRTTKSTA